MDSVKANLKKAKEERRRAETEIYSSQNPFASSLLKTESCFPRTSSNPDISVIRSCAQSSHTRNVCLHSRKDSYYITKFLGIMIFFIHVSKIVSF